MKITNSGISNASLNSKEPVQAVAQTARSSAANSISPNADLYMPSQEWLRLQSLLHQQQEIRSDRVAIAADRLKAGYYITSKSAHETAAAMMNSLD